MIPLDHQQSNRWLQTAHEEEDAAVPRFLETDPRLNQSTSNLRRCLTAREFRN